MTKTLIQLSVQQLKRAIAIRTQIEALEQELARVMQSSQPLAKPVTRPPKRKMSAEAKAKISAAQTARWAKRNKVAVPGKAEPKQKRNISAAGRARITAGTKARWAKYNAAKKAAGMPEAPTPGKTGMSAKKGAGTTAVAK